MYFRWISVLQAAITGYLQTGKFLLARKIVRTEE